MASVARSILALLTLLASLATAQTATSGAPAPGSTISLLLLNATSAPLTAYVQDWDPSGQTTYLINCAASDANTCGIHEATLSIVTGETYDFHTAVNNGGALTIHCTFEADGRTPASCTRTVAGGPDGYEVSTSIPTPGQWAYLPVRITKKAEDSGYEASGSAAMVSAASTAAFGASTAASMVTATTGVAGMETSTTAMMSGNGVGRAATGGGPVLMVLVGLGFISTLFSVLG